MHITARVTDQIHCELSAVRSSCREENLSAAGVVTHGTSTAVHGGVFRLLLGDTGRLVHPAPSCRECGGTSCSMWCSRGQSAPIDTPLVAGDQIGGLLQRCSEMDQVMSEATAELDAMRW